MLDSELERGFIPPSRVSYKSTGTGYVGSTSLQGAGNAGKSGVRTKERRGCELSQWKELEPRIPASQDRLYAIQFGSATQLRPSAGA
jgi:hypothetical protein